MKIIQRIHNIAKLFSSDKKSLRKMAKELSISKSSVHRHLKRIKQRADLPLAAVWETSDGYEWLKRLITAVIFDFGVKKLFICFPRQFILLI